MNNVDQLREARHPTLFAIMSLSAWRQFQLYENVPIRDPFIESDNPLYSDPTLTSVASINESFLAIAVQSSKIKIVNLDEMKVELEFTAYTEEYQLTYLESVSETFILSVAECLGKPVLIKLWNLEKVPKNEQNYHSMSEVRNGANAYPVSTVSSNLKCSCIAVGFTDGRIMLIRGDLLRDRGSKYRIIYEDPNKEPITSLSLSNDANCLFAATTSKIMSFNTSGRNNGKPDIMLNESDGVALKCGALNTMTDEFVCGLKDRLEFYKSSGTKRSLIVDIHTAKRLLPVSKDHILLLMSNTTKSKFQITKTPTETTKVIILDIRNKIISLTLIISSSVIDIFSDSISINLITSDGVIHRLKRKPINEQLSIICQKETFPIALEVGRQNDVSFLKLQEVRKAYGDYLFKKGMKKEAIEQYMECLDVCDPTEVISKFGIEQKPTLDDSVYLKEFLWKLVEVGFAQSDHVTLLLTIMIKLKDLKGISFFYEHFTREGTFVKVAESFGNWSMNDDTYFYSDKTLFDLDVILRLLIECNMQEQAYNIALKYSKDPLQVVNIILMGKRDSYDALRYIKSLPVDDALRVLIKFSRKLLDVVPNETNLLLIDLFTGQYQPINYLVNKAELKSNIGKHEPIVFYNYRSFFDYMIPSTITSDDYTEIPKMIQPTYHPPKPSLIFPSFVLKPFEFVVFLEACLESYKTFQGYDQDRQDILTTLYDVYLSLSEDDIEQRKSEWKQKAWKVLHESENLVNSMSEEKKIDSSLMLLISHMHHMSPLTSSENDIDEPESRSAVSRISLADVFRSMCLTEDPKECLTFLQKYGKRDKDLYKIAMAHFISSKRVYDEIGGEAVFKETILKEVVALDLMPPLDIIQTLSSTNVVKYSLVKEFLIRHIKNENTEIQKNKLLVESYQKELDASKQKLSESLAQEKPLQVKIKNRMCDTCHTMLEFPMIYFKCGHLYHQRCLNEEDGSDMLYKCPQCVAEADTAKKMMQSYQSTSQNTDMLRAALSDTDPKADRFGIITDFIGKGGLDDAGIPI